MKKGMGQNSEAGIQTTFFNFGYTASDQILFHGFSKPFLSQNNFYP